ncbi:hypothetical protein [Streptomyces collinus]|uniref:hypothetical protein n=1 Tax=Streptomyces collinus TaxID=42684 RepID=UPI0036B963EC
MIEYGYVHDVREVTLGSFLDGDHLTGATTLKVMDAADFNEEGGSLVLEDQTLIYLSVDMEADTIVLASPLAADYDNGLPLYITPLSYEKQAVVVLDGFDEAITAIVPHSLYDRLPDGIREDFARESVTIELENSTWLVKNVYGIVPTIDGQYLENVVADDVIDGIITEVKLANDAVTQAKIAANAVGNSELINAAVDAAKIANDAVTNAALAAGAVDPDNLTPALNSTVLQRWTDDFDSSDAWTVTPNTGASWSIVSGSAQVGGNVGQATGYVTVLGKHLITYDPNTIYRVSVRVRATVQPSSGADNVYLGVAGYAGDKTTYVNRDGANSQSAMYYPAALLQPVAVADGWTTYTGYLKGRAATGASAPGGPANDIQNPYTVHADVRYIAPWLLFNYTKRENTSVMQVDSVTIEALRTGVVTAAEISANAVTASKILAGSITADKLTIGSAGNMLADPSFEGAYTASLVSGNSSWSVDSTKGNGSSKSLKVDATAGVATTRTLKVMTIPWQAGETLYLSYAYQASSTYVGTPKFYATWKDSSGTTLTWGVAQPTTVVVGGSAWNVVSGTFTAPANTVSADIAFESFNGTAGQLWFDTAVCRPVWSGTSIADGAITTVKLAALSVTANELAANAVTAAKILAGEIGATHLAAGAVTAGKIAAGAVQAGNIAAGAIQTGDLAANAVTTAKLAALSVTANELAANAVTASKILVGEVTASKLDVNALIGKTAQSSNYVNDPENGITGWSLQADGSVYIRSATVGNDLYSISPTGDAKFQSLSVNDIFVNGDDFQEYVGALPRGILNVYPLSGALTYAAINTDYLVTRFIIPAVEARMYRIILDNFRFDRGSGSSSPTQFGVDVYCKYGSQASTADSLIHTYLRGAGYNASAADDIWTSSHDFSPPDANLGQDLHIAIYTSINSGAGNVPRLEATSNTRVIVEDVGGKITYAPTTDITNYVAPAKTTYTKTYSSTWMSTWGTNSGRRTDGKAYQGNYSSTNGNNYTKYGFSSAIQTDLSGATVKKVELYLDNTHFYSNSGGNAIIGTHANSTQPTGSSSTTGTYGRQSTAFTYGQAKWVTLSSAFGTDLKSGAALGITLGRTSGGTLAEYGYFTSSAQLRITYEK